MDLESWVARTAVGALHARYFAALDQCDHKQVRACFTPDVVATYAGGEPMHGIDALMNFIDGFFADVQSETIKITTHFMGNFDMRRLGATLVETEMPVVVYTVRPTSTGPQDSLSIRGIRYFDRLRRDDDEWLICERIHAVDWGCVAPANHAATHATRFRSPWTR
jgi:hypothetical protein